MFKKPLKIKSNSQIKCSERKSLKEILARHFPTLSETDIEALLPKKDVVSSIKIATASGETVQVYAVQKIPLIFDVRGIVYPTICLLWKFPNLVPCLTTHRRVMSNLNSGADFMAAGIVTPPAQSGLSKYGNFCAHTIASVNLTDNKAPIAVGITTLSSADIAAAGGRGKCLTILHLYGDKLCKLDGLNCTQMPNLGPPEWLQLRSYTEDFPQLGAPPSPRQENVVVAPEIVEDVTVAPVENNEEPPEPINNEMSVEEVDQLLNYCFFAAIKYSKTLVVPLLTSTFFKLQMLPVCPEGKNLDLKKSSYKKLKPFLDFMAKEGVIVVKEAKKGVESITSINREHPKFNEFYIDPSIRPKKPQEESSELPSTSVTESYMVTAATLPLFSGTRFGKGDTVHMSDIRKSVTEYAKNHNCQDEDNKRLVIPKDDLKRICKTENKITWEELMERVCESMKSCYKVSSGMDEIINKGKVAPINISVATRSGNKKVTLIDNLELFGIKISEFSKECQHGVAASTSISRPPGKKCDQLLVQGNQVLFVYNLLTEKYKVPQKYVKGLDNAPKKKKK